MFLVYVVSWLHYSRILCIYQDLTPQRYDMHFVLPAASILLASLTSASPTSKRATTLIPQTVFDSTANLEQYFTYNYPWGGDTHNGILLQPSTRLPSRNITNSNIQAAPAWTKTTSKSSLPAP